MEKLYVGHSESNYFVFGEESCYVTVRSAAPGVILSVVVTQCAITRFSAVSPSYVDASVHSLPGDAWQACVLHPNSTGGGDDNPM